MLHPVVTSVSATSLILVQRDRVGTSPARFKILLTICRWIVFRGQKKPGRESGFKISPRRRWRRYSAALARLA